MTRAEGPSDAPAGLRAIDAPGRPTDLVPDWLVNLAALGWRALAVAAAAIVLLFIAAQLWTVTASIAVAVVVAAVFAPLVLRLRAAGRSRNAAAGIVWATAILVILGALLLLALAFLPYISELATRIQAGLAAFQAAAADLGAPGWVDTLVDDATGVLGQGASEAIGGLVAAAAGAVTVAILATFLVFFFLRDGDLAWLWIFQGLGAEKRERVTSAGDDALERVGGYLRGTTILSAIIAVTDLAFMWSLGVPLALPLAVLVFFAGYIPYFGGLVSTAIILIVSLAALGGGPTLLLLVLMAARSFAVGYFVRPSVYGRTVDIHPALVLLALPAGYQIAGVVGLFAAVPVAAVILAVAGATIDIIEPVPPPPLPGPVPAWLDRLAQFSWRLLVAFAFVALLVGILLTVPLVVMPIILACIIAATLNPLVDVLVRRGRPRGQAAAISVGGAFAIIIFAMALAFASLFEQAGEMAGTVISGATSASDGVRGQLDLGVEAVRDGAAQAVGTIASLADGLAAIVTVTLLGTLLAFYGLRDGSLLWSRAITHVDEAARPSVEQAARRAFGVLGGYMIGTGAISFVGASSQLVIMLVLGLPLALPVFVLSFFLGFIPYIGGFLSTGIAFLIAFSTGSTTDVLIMGAWTVLFNLVQGNIVSPLVYGRTVHIHPAIVLVAIPAGSAVAGILGMFIVVPAIGIVAATWRTVLALIGGRPAPVLAEGAAPGELGSAAPAELSTVTEAE